MKSQAITALGQPLQEIEKDIPAPQGKQVLIKTRHCGVCHSDLHLHDGYFSLGGDNKLTVKTDESLPFVLGHEVEGTVAALGPDVEGVEVGKSYAVYPWIGCGHCGICESGEEQLCTRPRAIGITVDGGYSEYVMVPDPKYLIEIGEQAARAPPSSPISIRHLGSGTMTYS